MTCGEEFSLSDEVVNRYPDWTPRFCRAHSKKKKIGRKRSGSGSREENLPLAEVLDRYTDGLQDGVFTDGGCVPNPGEGGWGVVHVADGQVLAQLHGRAPDTTNNRMELTALIEGVRLLPTDSEVTVFTDSQLCVSTINDWAAGWERRGWKRKTGAIKNLELVQELYALKGERPGVTLAWVKAHSGNRWNEYADSLASAWRRETL